MPGSSCPNNISILDFPYPSSPSFFLFGKSSPVICACGFHVKDTRFHKIIQKQLTYILQSIVKISTTQFEFLIELNLSFNMQFSC